jgi:DNA-binding response OmpR family regulator
MRSILIIDDDADVREVIAFKLGRLGVEVVTASDGETGLEAVTQLRPDLVVLDGTMPKLSGLEVCRRIREGSDNADVPVIMLSARAQEADRRSGLAAGADDYIVKPFSPSALADRVEAVLARPARTRERRPHSRRAVP